MGIVSQKPLTQTKTVAPELKDEYVSAKLPVSQAAHVSFPIEEGVVVSETKTEDKENIFKNNNKQHYFA